MIKNNDLPAFMTQVVITEPGGVDKLQLENSPLPSLPPHYMLVKVNAAGVNRPDIFNVKVVIHRQPMHLLY